MLGFPNKIAEEISRSVLIGDAAKWFKYLVWSTRLVVVGVVIEGIEIIWEVVVVRIVRWVKAVRERADFRAAREIFPTSETIIDVQSEAHVPGWVKVIAFIGLIFVAVGVAGEWIFEVKFESTTGAIQTLDESAITKLRSENLRLQALINPRTLSLEQLNEIGKALVTFNGRSVTVAWVDPESHALAEQLKAALHLAGISARIPESSKLITTPNGRIYSYTYSLPVETGVRINWPPEQSKFGRTLCNSLQGKVSDLKCVPQAGSLPTIGLAPMTGPPEPGVLISVLTKPFDVLQ